MLKKKDSFEPDSKQRPTDVNYVSTVLKHNNNTELCSELCRVLQLLIVSRLAMSLPEWSRIYSPVKFITNPNLELKCNLK